ncbi:MAG TPA: hypothetical protein IAA04_11090 [Candidatus Lachnoclostridium pullistercoris]|uniref:Uncharacterized protein n=1 Tax=Candidatus Lachnoclostridium pullistercoris TaxID=2838632 RepID=A0A9D2T7V6_9FIRM|nr:hypothetical protein [Candidatus Lachnoclostridium pullistercoris]
MRKIMAVWDTNPLYAERLADFANERGRIPFRAVAFASADRLKEYAAKHSVEILLAGSDAPAEDVKEVRARQVIYLGEEKRADPEKLPSVYKYQNSDRLMREVMACYEGGDGRESVSITGRGKVIGVYSPVGRCRKTALALTLAQVWKESERTLFVTFEDCSGMKEMTGETYGECLSDLLYRYRHGGSCWEKIGAFIYTWGNVDYIPPFRYPEDLEGISGIELAGFLEDLAAEAGYGVIVVDVGQTGRQAAELLESCDVVYMPVLDDWVSQAKIREFEEYLAESGRDGVTERLEKVKLPVSGRAPAGENYPEQLLWGELGDYVRRLVGGGREREEE